MGARAEGNLPLTSSARVERGSSRAKSRRGEAVPAPGVSDGLSRSGDRLERLPPQNVEAEKATLGAMLLEGEAAGLAAESLSPDEFYRSEHQTIFRAICEVYDAGTRPDELTVCEHLSKQGLLEQVGGQEYIHSLVMSVPSAANLERYARIVKEKALARSLIAACTAILRDTEEGTDIQEVLDRSEQRIFECASRRGAADVVEIKDILQEELAALEARIKNPGAMTGLRTHFRDLDEMTGGFQKGDFLILAARPSVGKTALALTFMEHVSCDDGNPAVLFSLEMSKPQIALRMVCSRSGIDYRRIRTGIGLDPVFAKVVNEGFAPLSEAKIFIDDTASIGVMELRAKARRMKASHDIKLVVVDYLQLMRAPERADSREQEVAKVSRALKALARELDVPVLALSQIRRAAEEREGGRPQLADLRESGALEQDADVVMILHRDRIGEGQLSNEATLTVAKQRNGPTGSVKLTFLPQFMRFEAWRAESS